MNESDKNQDSTRITRKDVASWIEGPPRSDGSEWPGQKLGIPKDGPTQMATFGKRIIAVFIDWFIAGAVSAVLFPSVGWSTLAVFFVLTFLQLGLFGATVGKRLFRMQVVEVGGASLSWGKALLRTVLLCLFVPALIMDADGRGAHDKIPNTVEIAFAPREYIV